jgi:hypothetical protein
MVADFYRDDLLLLLLPSAAPGLPDVIFFKATFPIWVNFGRPWNGNVGIFHAHLEYICIT